MKDLLENILLILLLLLAGSFAFLFFMAVNAGKFRYKETMIFLEEFVPRASVTQINYKFILSEFNALRDYNIDTTRTQRVFHTFTNRFAEYWKTDKAFLIVHNQIMSA